MSDNPPIIFISGRFRSGSSFLWQLFDQLPGFCAWYEPLHPQLLTAIEHTRPKSDHVGVQDYWSAYRQHPGFREHYRSTFATEQLYLEATDQAPELLAYIKHLIKSSAPEVPVLQFNRMDLRLPWLKARFPEAVLIHSDRNPLQLYHSQRRHIAEADRHDPNHWDAYELMPWCWSLSEAFPFLLSADQPHAFFRCYLLHRMSALLAGQYADLTINLDQHVFESRDFIRRLAQVVSLTAEQQEQLIARAHVPDLPVFAAELTEELAAIMTEVDLLLTASGLHDSLGKQPLSEIRQAHPAFWRQQQGISARHIRNVLQQLNALQAEMTRILAENEALKTQLEELTTLQAQPPTDHE
jgi:hypothetical protein